MNQAIVTETEMDGADVAAVCKILEDVLVGCPEPHAYAAMISLILFNQNPNLTEEQLGRGVQEISRYISLWIHGVDTPEILEPSQVN